MEIDGLDVIVDQDSLVVPLFPPSRPAPLLRVGELRNPDALLEKLSAGSDLLSAYLWARFTANARAQLEAYEGGPPLPAALARVLAEELSRLIQQETSLYAPERFGHAYLPDDIRPLADEPPSSAARPYFNRRLLEIGYPEEIARREATGLSLEPPRPLFHFATASPQLKVLFVPREKRQYVVQCSVECADPGFRQEWVRWSFRQRDVTTGTDGGATAGINEISEDGANLRLEIQPSDVEGRVAMLGFDCRLDRETTPGDYDFKIKFTVSSESGAPNTYWASATLMLRQPESRYMSYLPSLYREQLEPRSEAGGQNHFTSLFSRFVLGVEESAEPTWQLLGRLHAYFGAFTTSPEFLSWLASWIGLALNENWPEAKRRLLLRRAVRLYTRRGTPGGLEEYLEIYTGIKPTIHDQPITGSFRLGPKTALGSGTHLGESRPHTFTVIVSAQDTEEVQEQIVRKIIEAEKPAHTDYVLHIKSHA